MTAGSLRGVCWQLDGCCGQRVRTFTSKTNHRLTTVWLHRPKLICEWISAEFSRVKDASVASDLKLSSVNKGKNHTLEHQQHLKWKRNKFHLKLLKLTVEKTGIHVLWLWDVGKVGI